MSSLAATVRAAPQALPAAAPYYAQKFAFMAKAEEAHVAINP
jgi:hypothetical protein